MLYSQRSSARSERAPVPIPRHTPHNTLPFPTTKTSHPELPLTPHSLPTNLLPRPHRALAITPTAPRKVPSAVIEETVFAGAAACAAGVVGGGLVEGDRPDGVRVAEDVAAAPAVVAAGEVCELAGASRFVAEG